ncbi:MAG: glycosyltransferase family 4 protein [Phycisphaerae bacterium]|nr:glycosyltransferase family 4 protein [Phycisphaerae bacterium]
MTIRPVFLVDRQVFQGYCSYIRRILVGLTGTAHASALVCPSCVNTEAILCPSVEQIEHPALRLPVFWYPNRRILLERLSRFKPTILHAFYPGQIHLAHWLSQQLDIPYVLTLHRSTAQWLRFEKSIRDAAGIIAPSETVADHLQKNWPGLSERIKRIHIGSFVEDSCRCFFRSGQIASLIAIHPLDDASVFKPFLNAVRHLVLDGFDLMVVMMGKGRKEKHIRRQIRILGLISVVTVIPPMRPVRSIFSGADIYLHLEDTGGFDARLLEAMAVGLAVAGVSEKSSGLLHDGQTACFWDGADELSIYGCLKKLLGQRAETRQLAINGQAHLRKHNSVSRMVDELMKTYIEAQHWYKDHYKELEKESVMIG